jgi:phage gp29-like protein
VASGLTPDRLASILNSAKEGDIESYLELAEQMEERDLHYRGVLNTRKQAVVRGKYTVEPFDETPRAQDIAEQCEELVVKTDIFSDMLFHLLDALGKSYSVIETVWDTTKTPWVYKEFAHKDPRWFHFDRVTHRELRIRDDSSYEGLELPGGAFVVHTPTIKSGLPIRAGLAFAASIAYMTKMYTIKDWMAFMEVYGMPLRIGKYDPETIKEPERLQLKTALANLGHDAAAMIPEGMEIDIVDIKRGSGSDSLFGGYADYIDKQVSKALLGQTMTTDDGSSLAQAEVHETVRQDIKESDAVSLSSTVQKGIIAPWVGLNFGENAPMPRFTISVAPPEDLKTFTETVLPWVEKAGLEISAPWVREKFGIPEPDDGEDTELLGAAPAVATQALKVVSDTEDLAEQGADEWERVMAPHRRAVVALANKANSYEEFQAGLAGLVEQFDSDPFVNLLAEQTTKARGQGESS